MVGLGSDAAPLRSTPDPLPQSMGVSCWDDIDRHVAFEHFWMADPIVRRRIGQRIAGDPECGYSAMWFARRMHDALPYDRVLSIGCGTGPLERSLALLNVARHITGIDTSATAIAYATDAAAAAGVRNVLSYERADAHAFLVTLARNTHGFVLR